MTDLLMRTSERSTFKTCRFQWHLAYEEQLEPKTDKPALRFGTLVHKSLEKFYRKGTKRGPKPAETFQKLYAEELEEQAGFGFYDEDGTWQEAGQMGVSMLEAYHREYGDDDEWYVLATEQPFRVPVFPRQRRRTSGGKPKLVAPLFYYTGVIDLVVRNRATKFIGFVDHKTAKSVNVQQLILNEQAGAYWTFGAEWLYERGILKPEQELSNITFNFLRKAVQDTRPQNAEGHYLNKNGSVSKQQPPPYFQREPVWRDPASRTAVRQRVRAEFMDMQRVRSKPALIYKNPSSQHCGGCAFKDACELHEDGQDWRTLLEATTKTWDPYDVHKTYEAETRA